MKKNLLFKLVVILVMLPTSIWARQATPLQPIRINPVVRVSNNGATLTFLNSDTDVTGDISIEDSYSSAPSWCTSKVKKVVFDSSFSIIRPTSTAYWFNGCTSLTTIEGITNLKVDSVKSMAGMFRYCSSLTTLDLYEFNTISLSNAQNMFSGCISLQTIYGKDWHIFSNMTNDQKAKIMIWKMKHPNANYMFSGCTKLKGGNGTTFVDGDNSDYAYCKVDGGTSSPGYFTAKGSSTLGAYAVDYKGTLTFYYDAKKNTRTGTKYDINWGRESGFNKNTTIKKVVIDNSMSDCLPTTMDSLFAECYALEEIEGAGRLNAAYATSMKYMFYRCCSLKSFDLKNLISRRATSMEGMFEGCYSLGSVNVDNTTYMSTNVLTNVSRMFYECISLQALDFTKFNTSNVTDMSYLLYDCFSLKSLDISSLNTENVTNMRDMFANCYSMTTLDLSTLNTAKVTNMASMFGDDELIYIGKLPTWMQYRNNIINQSQIQRSSLLKSINLMSFNTSNVTDMRKMFYNCKSLDSLELRGFNTSKVTRMDNMFLGCSSLKTLYLSTFDTQQVTDMSGMFYDCSALADLEISSFNTSSVTDMGFMFRNCSSLTELYLGSFNTSKVKDMYSMFDGCTALKTIYVLDTWSTNAITDGGSMFSSCTSLIGGSGTAYSSSNTNYTYAHIDGGTSNPGYLTNLNNFVPATGTKQAYAVFNNGVLTFYYDNKAGSRTGTKFEVPTHSFRFNLPTWVLGRVRWEITSVNFDASFSSFKPTSTAYWFYNLAKCTSINNISNLNTSQVTNMAEMFRYCYVLDNLDLRTFDTSNVTDMSCMFCYDWALTNVNVSNFNTSKVTDMQHLFHQCPLSNVDISSFNTENVKQMNIMFAECPNLKTLDLKNFNTSNVENMDYMFIGDSKLTTIYASDLWSTAKVQSGEDMFYGDTKLVGSMGTTYSSEHVDQEYAAIDGGLCAPGYLSGEYKQGAPEAYAVLTTDTLTFYYDGNKNCRDGIIIEIKDGGKNFNYTLSVTSGVDVEVITKAIFDESFARYTPTNTAAWFNGFKNLLSIEDIRYLNTSNVVDMKMMFYYCESLTNLDLSSFNTSKVTDMNSMFCGCKGLTRLDLSSFNTAKVTDMHDMFSICEGLTALNVTSFNTVNVTNMEGMFQACSNLPIIDISNINTSNVTNMAFMFQACHKIENLDLSNFDTHNVIGEYDVNNDISYGGMKGMFLDCKNLKSINLSSFNTEKVVTMDEMFWWCESLESLDLSSFNSKGLKTTERMFSNCFALKSINLSGLITDNVVTMRYMFEDCRNLADIDVSHFNTSNVVNMGEMFWDCNSLESIDISNFNTSKVTNTGFMFYDCGRLSKLSVGDNDFSNVVDTRNMFGSGIGTTVGTIEKPCSLTVGTKFDLSVLGSINAGQNGNPDYYIWNNGYFTAPTVSGTPTSIGETIMNVGDEDTDASVYNMSGQRVDRSSKGLVIVKGKNGVRKVFKK